LYQDDEDEAMTDDFIDDYYQIPTEETKQGFDENTLQGSWN
jgi:hypothetical protein